MFAATSPISLLYRGFTLSPNFLCAPTYSRVNREWDPPPRLPTHTSLTRRAPKVVTGRVSHSQLRLL